MLLFTFKLFTFAIVVDALLIIVTSTSFFSLKSHIQVVYKFDNVSIISSLLFLFHLSDLFFD